MVLWLTCFTQETNTQQRNMHILAMLLYCLSPLPT